MGRGLGHLAAHLKDFIKNGSQIKILKIPQILMKISEYSILDHIVFYIIIISCPKVWNKDYLSDGVLLGCYCCVCIQLLHQPDNTDPELWYLWR